MNIIDALTLLAVMVPLAVIPSASVVLVVARSVGAGRASGAFAAAGIVAGDLVFVGFALIGMNALAEWLGTLFSVVRYIGAAYLIWLGIGLLRSGPSPSDWTTQRNPSFIADFLAGLLLTLGDVKAILFYASLFPTVIDMSQLKGPEALLIVAITIVSVGGVKLAYVMFASTIVKKCHSRLSSEVPRKLAGSLMIGCGSTLIMKA